LLPFSTDLSYGKRKKFRYIIRISRIIVPACHTIREFTTKTSGDAFPTGKTITLSIDLFKLQPKPIPTPMKRTSLLSALLIIIFETTTGTAADFGSAASSIRIGVEPSATAIRVSFETDGLDQPRQRDGETDLTIVGEGCLLEYDQPMLPMVSRFVAIPPTGPVSLSWNATLQSRMQLDHPPALCRDRSIQSGLRGSSDGDLYPSQAAEISAPMIIRGVRMVKLTTYPVQFDRSKGELVLNPRIETTLDFTQGAEENEVVNPRVPRLTPEFKRFLKAMVVNPEEALRDEGEGMAPQGDYYLVATNSHCLEYVAPFIEWRRKSGCRVDILVVPDGNVRNPATIRNLIRDRYNALINARETPFDQLLLVGDRSSYTWPPAAGWILDSERGESVWAEPQHADYKYACLEGNDNYPDVGVSRFCAGSPDILNLFVLRTLAYEMEPSLEDSGWFGRGAAYSQHWGNDPDRAWHPSIHTNVRWAEEALKRYGFDDVRYFEDMTYDQDGQRVGAFERTQFNERVNLMLGRAESLIWAQSLNGIRENTVFPIRITLSGHGEYATWKLLRGSTPNSPKGPVAATCNWGGPATISTSAVWLETVNGVLQHGLSFGWARTLAVTQVERYFPNFGVGQTNVYGHIKTDNDFYGDPGIRAWRGYPRQIVIEHPESVSPSTKLFEVAVTDPDDGTPVSGVKVTLYAPGEMPDFAAAAYADYNDMQVWSLVTDRDGMARFSLDEEVMLVEGTSLYVTASGEQIAPAVGEVPINVPVASLELESYRWEQVEGNDDEFMNPGEDFRLFVTAQNTGEAAFEDCHALLSSLSEDAVVENEGLFSFGNIAAGASAECREGMVVRLTENVRDGLARPDLKPALKLDFSSGENHWITSIRIDPVARSLAFDHGTGALIPGQDAQVAGWLKNDGRIATLELRARLISESRWIGVNDRDIRVDPIQAGDSAIFIRGEFPITPSPRVLRGTNHRMKLALSSEEGYRDTLTFYLYVQARPATNTPLGPDDFGYICLDDGDTGWVEAPDYDWIEINPNAEDQDYDGELVPFEGRSDFDIGEMVVLPLPETMQFYGEFYDSISICTNGYLAPGSQRNALNFQNWDLSRGFGGGAGMIAPFWDWLRFGENSAVYAYHDGETGMFIVEWSRLLHHSGENNELSFQVILHDRSQWANETGESDILFQYRTIVNQAGTMNETDDIPFASVGISSPNQPTGIGYTFRNTYPRQAEPLAPRRALRFTTSLERHEGVIFGRVEGAIFGDSIAAPLAGVTVRTGYGLAATTDENGRYTINRVVNGMSFAVIAGGYGWFDTTLVDQRIGNNDSLEVNFILSPNAAVDEPVSPPTKFRLLTAYPNPFNSTVSLYYTVQQSGEVELAIYDLSGRLVERLASDRLAAGDFKVIWDAEGVGAGVYLVKLETGEVQQTMKLVLVR
jgi:hypothetical protein